MRSKKQKPSRVVQCLDQFQPGTVAAQEAVELLQKMVRVDTSNPPGNEIALATFLQSYVESEGHPNLSTTIIESEPTRANLIITIAGSNPQNHPSWGFMSHLDVVPAEGTWQNPPFSGEIIQEEHDQFIWGRGTVDIKGLGAANITALLTLLREGFQPQGNIKILLCADEECGGFKGLGFLVDNYLEDVQVDCCLNEGGGFKLPLKNDFMIQIGEKGIMWTKLRARGQGGHGSMPPPPHTIALFKMVQVLERLKNYRPPLILGQEYQNLRRQISLPGVAKWLMGRKTILRSLLGAASKIAKQNLGQVVLPLVQDSISFTNFHSGVKENSISPVAEAILDIRALPGHDRPYINQMLEKAIGSKLFRQLELEGIDNTVATTSSFDTPEFQRIEAVTREMWPEANLVPLLSQGSTDCKYFRKNGILAYGFSPTLKDPDLSYKELLSMAHGENERISVSNLRYAMDFAYRMMRLV